MTSAAGSISSKASVKAANNQTQVATQQQSGRTIMTQYINRMSGEIAKALPSVMTPERFTRIVTSVMSSNEKLQQCSPSSFLGAMMTSAQLGLEPNTPLGQAYLIPRWNKNAKCMECTFQIGYKGLIDLAYRSGQVSSIEAVTVYENDDFYYEKGMDAKIIHRPVLKGRGDPIGFYAIVRFKDGGCKFDVMGKEEIDMHAAQYSEAVKNGWTSPWKTNYEQMAKKTVLKRCLKLAPLKTDFARAVIQDETVHDTVGEDMTLEPITLSDVIDVTETTETPAGGDEA